MSARPLVEPVELAGDALRVVIDSGRGGEVRHIGRPGGPNVLADAAWGAPLPASRSAGYGSDQLDWMSEYRGGWQELFPNAGAACVMDGVPLPYHGEASTARWEVLSATGQEVVLRTPARLPLVLERRMRVAEDRPVLLVEETVRNECERRVAFIWGHHPALPAVAGMRIDAPRCIVRADDGWRPAALDVEPGATGTWPTLGPIDLATVPEGPVERYCFLTDLPAGWAALRDPAAGNGVAFAWDVETWPHAWLWVEVGGRDFPWYGRGSFVAVEPQRAWPGDGLQRARERGQALVLDGGACARSWLTCALFDADERPVEAVARDGTVHRQEEGR